MSGLTHETVPAPAPATTEGPVLRRLSTLDRFLPVWILAAMGAGLLLGRLLPGLDDALSAVAVGSVSLPIALGLLVMMYPVLAKVRYDELGHVSADKPLLLTSILLNWVLGPALMFALAWLLLPDLPAYRTGLIIVGLARCIAMVLIWNDLACGDRQAAAILVAINAVFQILAFAGLGYFYLQVLPRWLGLPTTGLDVSVWPIARSVLIFLGIPLLAGYLTRSLGERARGRDWYENRLLPRIGPLALYGLLFTIVILFALQGGTITHRPLDVARIALPLLAYFAVMWTGSFTLGRRLRMTYERTTTLAFTAAGNNFELAIAVAVGVFGVTSGQALAGGRRTPHRGAGARRPGLRRTLGPSPLPPTAGDHPWVIHPRCCSCVCTTPAARRWPPPSWTTTPTGP
jgi:ACR3 family arsenite transporter